MYIITSLRSQITQMRRILDRFHGSSKQDEMKEKSGKQEAER